MMRYQFVARNGKVVLLLTGTERDEGEAEFIIGGPDAGRLFGAESIRASHEAERQVPARRLVGGER